MKEILRRVVVYILTLEAKIIIAKYKPRIAVVTGSVGKTSTKDAVYTALSAKFFVRKSEKSFNSDIGAPLTVLGVPNGWSNPVTWVRNIIDGLFLIVLRAPYPEWLVVEVGADRPGDISQSLAWIKPELVVGTRFPELSVHVEFYDSPEAVQEEEMAPIGWLKAGGVFVGNNEDQLAKQVTAGEGVRKVLYGFDDTADVYASRLHVSIKNRMPTGMLCDVHAGDEKARLSLPGVIGEPHIASAIAGIASAIAVDVPLADAAAAFEGHAFPPGRMRILAGTNDSVLIDDTYNSSPVASEVALRTLKDIPRKGKRIAVLGDMLELGAYSVPEHENAGRQAAESCDVLVTVGVRARSIAVHAEAAGMPRERIFQFDTSTDAGEHVKAIVEPGDVVLLKGSQSIRVERAVKVLMANPSDAKKLLVRQDAEWLSR